MKIPSIPRDNSLSNRDGRAGHHFSPQNTKKHIVLAGNGSVIRNDFFRDSLNDELRFQFPDIKWIFSSISPAYGAGILAARLYGIDLQIGDILKGNVFAEA